MRTKITAAIYDVIVHVVGTRVNIIDGKSISTSFVPYCVLEVCF